MPIQRQWTSIVGGLCLFWIALATQISGLGVEKTDGATARVLVAKLGDASFVVRKRAMADLTKMGLPALPALVEGSRSSNREIRYRSKHVLVVVRDLDFQQRLIAFLKDKEPDKYQLPGWDRFKTLAGVSPESKHVFVEMHRSEQALMAQSGLSGTQLNGLLNQRVSEYTKSRPAADGVPTGFTAAILFASSDTRVPMTPTLTSLLYRLALDSRNRRNITDGSDGQDEVMRTLLLAFLQRYGKSDPYRSMNVCLNYGMPQALGFAVKILDGESKAGSRREAALLTVNLYGGKTHLPLVEKFLDDTYMMARTRRRPDGTLIKYKVQIRDVALATAITLAGEDHVKCGFPHARKSELQSFDVSSLEFPSDGDRQAAISAWKKRRPSKADEDPATDGRP